MVVERITREPLHAHGDRHRHQRAGLGSGGSWARETELAAVWSSTALEGHRIVLSSGGAGRLVHQAGGVEPLGGQ